MRAAIYLTAGFLFVAVVQALPADPKAAENKKLGRVELEKDAEEFPVPNVPEDPIIYDGFLGGITDLFERMRQQMLYLMSHVPRIGYTTPEGGNTTSVTKVIDGHKVTINETVYTSGDGDDAAAVFKVRVVDIHPDSGEGSEEAPGAGRGSVESVEISRENEIPRGGKQQKRKVSMEYPEDEANYNNLETFDEPDNIESMDEFNNLETFDDIETFDEPSVVDDIDNALEETVADLRHDVYVNTIAERRGKPHNPDAEFISGYEPNPYRDLSGDTRVNDIARNEGRKPNPDAEVFDPSKPLRKQNDPQNRPPDLSRDTEVNDIAKNLGMTSHPDVETFDPSQPMRHQDLSNDTAVNNIARIQGKTVNPDAEVFEPSQPRRPDLSRDILVNDQARNEGRTVNPFAEEFDPTSPMRHYNVFDLARDTIINEIDNMPDNTNDPWRNNRYFYRTD